MYNLMAKEFFSNLSLKEALKSIQFHFCLPNPLKTKSREENINFHSSQSSTFFIFILA